MGEIKQIQKVIVIALAIILSGCASKHDDILPPCSSAVVGAFANSRTSAAEVKKYVRPEGATAVKNLEDNLFQAQVELGKYVSKADEQSRELFKAQEKAEYWKEKQRKSLKELWFWRALIGLQLAAVVFWLAIKMR
jgi:hypothetical protein